VRVQTVFYKLLLPAVTLAVVAMAPSRVFATALPVDGNGILNISNLTGTLVGISNSCIDWANAGVCQTTTGIQDSVSGSDATQFNVGNTALDTIKDIPGGVSLPLVDFQTVDSPLAGGVVNFDLTSVVIPGALGNCASSAVFTTCSPAGSDFVLFQQTADQVAISFATNEIAYTGTSASGFTPYVGIFTTELSGKLPDGSDVNIPDILNYVAGGGTLTAAWSATESPVPEPSQFAFLFAAGLIGVVLYSRRRAAVN
jgi:PEP-CTERM motif-containing protein